MLKNISLYLLLIMLSGCTSIPKKKPPFEISAVVNQYLTTYQARDNFEHFLSFYDDEVVLEDMLYGVKATNKKAFSAFFNWQAGDFKVLNGKQTFEVSQIVIDDEQRTVVVSGVFNPFSFNEQKLGPWRFTTVLKFNQAGLIVYQQDWINYFPRSFVSEATNLNGTH
ncbi:nuclear transport factor 2 family protein [Pseudoalteromonas sp. SMS1]|uniref:nuclear transport factor 2 family protein n=1 Tax=Pseudoalteromonas sp. SMS1 TaxID=2908894 RepID=UPI001F396FA2|nr:nuclear transport factor 2 family protein [Pseudoalteromonas sp. SMS1]MCF2856933.1 nuclear transport factor 2 family protein [Pseudoalteromonas sp. SMS1]